MRDSNPRYVAVYTLSRRAPSATRTTLQILDFRLAIVSQLSASRTLARSLLGLSLPSPLRGRPADVQNRSRRFCQPLGQLSKFGLLLKSQQGAKTTGYRFAYQSPVSQFSFEIARNLGMFSIHRLANLVTCFLFCICDSCLLSYLPLKRSISRPRRPPMRSLSLPI